jgi:hypothetical protein
MTAREVLVELTKIGRANMADIVRAFFGCRDAVAAVDQLRPDRHEHGWGAGLADRLAAALARVGKADGGSAHRSGNAAFTKPASAVDPRSAQPSSLRPTDRRRRSPRAMRSARRRQNIARKVQKVARLK